MGAPKGHVVLMVYGLVEVRNALVLKKPYPKYQVTHLFNILGNIYCSPLNPPVHGELIYATEKGRINSTGESFYTGTLAEVQCEIGYNLKGDNLIVCLKDGTWDNHLPNCVLDENVHPTVFPIYQKRLPDKTFWQNFHNFLFFGCQPADSTKISIFCDQYDPKLKDLSTIEPLDRLNLTNVDQKLLDSLQRTLASINFHTIDMNNFFQYVMYQNETAIPDKFDESVENSLQLTICFYIDMFIVDPGMNSQENSETTRKILQALVAVVQPAYESFYKNNVTVSTRKPLNAIQAIIASKERERNNM